VRRLYLRAELQLDECGEEAQENVFFASHVLGFEVLFRNLRRRVYSKTFILMR